MIPTDWLGYRRIDDGELLGYLVPTDDGIVTPVTVFGYPLDPAGARGHAERRLDEVGLDYLADRWTLKVSEHAEAISVEIVEANPETLTVKNVDYGDSLNYGHRFTLKIPVTSGLRHA